MLLANDDLISLLDHHFPEPLQALWKDVQQSLAKHGPATSYEGKMVGGAVENTLRKIRNSIGSNIAKMIYELHQELQSWG